MSLVPGFSDGVEDARADKRFVTKQHTGLYFLALPCWLQVAAARRHINGPVHARYRRLNVPLALVLPLMYRIRGCRGALP